MKKLALTTLFILASVFATDTAFAAATITDYPTKEACQASCTTTGPQQGCSPVSSPTGGQRVTTWQCNAPSLMETVDKGSCTQSTPGADYTCTSDAGTAPIGCTEINNGKYRCPGANGIPEGYLYDIPVNSQAPVAQQSVTNSNSNCSAQHLCYTPLEPIPGLTLGGADLNFPEFLKAIFRLLFSLGALLAVGRLVIGGIMYMTAVSPSSKGQAKIWATSSLYGLLILAGSYLILFTINPDLIQLKFFVTPTSSVSSGGGVIQNTNTGGSTSVGNSTGGTSNTTPFAGMDCDNRGEIESTQDGCVVTCEGGGPTSCGASLGLTAKELGDGVDSVWFLSSDLTTPGGTARQAVQRFASDCSSITNTVLLKKQVQNSSGGSLTAYVCANK